jgi:tetratricopeptide (TPR) repeat protein
VSSAALRRALAWSATGALTLALALATRARNGDWSSEERLWQGVLAHVPDNPRAHDSLGDLRRRAGRLDEARAFFAEAVRLQPRFAMWRNNYGSSLYEARDLDGALEQFRTAVELDPGFALARANLGLVMYEKGHLKEAVDLTREALRSLPDHVAGYRTLAFALADLGESAEAAGYLRGVVKANPADLEAARKLIEVLATSPQAPKRCGDEAVARSEQLQAQLPAPDALWLSAFAAAYAQAAQWDRAIDLQSKARDHFDSSNDAAGLAEANRRLKLYQSHQPLRR